MGYRPIGNPSELVPHSAADSRSDGALGIEFKSSPYYEIQEQLGGPVVCEGMSYFVQVGEWRLIFPRSDAASSAYCQGYFESQRPTDLKSPQPRSHSSRDGVLLHRRSRQARHCIPTPKRNQGQYRRSKGEFTWSEEQTWFYQARRYNQGAASQSCPLHQYGGNDIRSHFQGRWKCSSSLLLQPPFPHIFFTVASSLRTASKHSSANPT